MIAVHLSSTSGIDLVGPSLANIRWFQCLMTLTSMVTLAIFLWTDSLNTVAVRTWHILTSCRTCCLTRKFLLILLKIPDADHVTQELMKPMDAFLA